MKIAVFGKTGQVAQALAQKNEPGIHITCFGRKTADFCDPHSVAGVIGGLSDDTQIVINAAAYTAVDKAETEPDLARLVNATSVGALARACAARDLPLIHISTDYVFDGTGQDPFPPDHPTGPLGVYGATKLAGEDAVRASGVRHVILRTSWVFSATGANFVKTMLRLGAERDALSVVADQTGGPTPAKAIADACIRIAAKFSVRKGTTGTYHYSGTPDVSWADFAREIFHQAGLPVTVSDISSADYPTPARRPLNSRLDCESLTRDYAIQRPDWKAGLAEVLKELT